MKVNAKNINAKANMKAAIISTKANAKSTKANASMKKAKSVTARCAKARNVKVITKVASISTKVATTMIDN